MNMAEKIIARPDHVRAAAARLTGIHAATVAPLAPAALATGATASLATGTPGADGGLTLDEAALTAHLAAVCAEPRIRGLLINGHAGENAQMPLAEKRRVVEIARQATPPGTFLTSGVYSEATAEAAAHARAMEEAGADAILVFPPNGWALGHDTRTALDHHAAIAAATGLPLVLYQAPMLAGRIAYSLETLEALVRLPSVAGVKEGSWEVARYEENWRMLSRIAPEVAVMASGDEHLLTSYLIGTVGSQVSLAAVVPGLVCDLWEAAAAGRWEAARAHHERLYPLAALIYRGRTGFEAGARLKACLKLLGIIPSGAVYAPNRETTPDVDEALKPLLQRLV
ncbi:dihydrodipicolinate synthetase [Stappia sp. 22II-S9-Z10]|nr:dihydrodipicolinate synthetase [Stappia sp. 22II-S9-Z10]